jgi:hypothetical protein
MFTGGCIFIINAIKVRANIEDNSILRRSNTERFWFGVIATKYENITSIPPI